MKEREQARLQIAERLRKAREMAGLSQTQVARLLGFHRPTVSEIEAGRRRVSAEELGELADIYSVSVAWLTTGTSAPGFSANLELAARELTKLRSEDLDTVMGLLQSLRKEAE